MNTCFFDLETKNLFEDIDKKYPIYSWSKKQEKCRILTPKLGMACACIINDKNNRTDFEEGEELELLKSLNKYEIIVGHNIIKFDYPVLSPYDKNQQLPKISNKTIDSFLALKEKTEQFVSLNDLGKLNLGLKKTENSKEIPAMWKRGEKKRVKEYCFNDVLLLKKIYELGLTSPIKCYKKNYGRIEKILTINQPW